MPANTDNTVTTVKKPMFGGSRLYMRSHGVKLLMWLPTQDPAFRSILERGYFSDSKRILCQSEQQAIDISKGLIDIYDPEDPAPCEYEQNDAAKTAAAASGRVDYR